MAENKADEIQAKRYEGRILRLYEEVTKSVLKGVKDKHSDKDRKKKIEKNKKKILKKATEKYPELEIKVMDLYNGNKYYLQGYFVIKDIRIVYVPPRSIGAYGGDVDNWMWPRHTGDFSFMRAYVSPEGRELHILKKTSLTKPVTWLKSNPKGVKAGDFTMVLGFPGTTNRFKDSPNINYQLQSYLPFVVDLLQGRLDVLESEGKKDEAIKIKYAETVKSYNNSMKFYGGELEAFKRIDMVGKKKDFEKGLMEFVAKDEILNKKAGSVITDFAKIYDERLKVDDVNYAIRSLKYSKLITEALNIYNFSIEKVKPPKKQDKKYIDAQKLKKNATRRLSSLFMALEKSNLKKGILKALELDEDNQICAISCCSEMTKDNACASVDSLIEGTKLLDEDYRNGLYEMSTEELLKTEDFFIIVASQIKEPYEKYVVRNKELNAKTDKIRRFYTEAAMKYKKSLGEDLYPDANRTFRFNYGYVEGYAPRDAVVYKPFTFLKGVMEKNTGVEPFDAPAKLTELYEAKDYGKWASEELGGLPLCFLTNHDITGGSSGSPILDADGKFVGCIFDGTYESLYSDYLFESHNTRSISVDIRYICYITEKFGGGFILDEMGISRN